MTAKELLEKTIALQRECNEKQSVLRKQYAIEHNPVKVGDVVTDHYHTIRVEKMCIYGHPVPFMRYHGTELTKRGEPKKRQPVPDNPVFQNHVISINGVPYKYEEENMRGKLWYFIRPADPKKVMRFENTGEDFSAMYQAQHWLHENGYCYGSSDWSHYIPAMKGDRYTLPQKLYNFDREDYDRVSAVMYSFDYRNGWVEVWLAEQGVTVLDLVLTYKWYDMIDSGEKREEYRDITPYWYVRLYQRKKDYFGYAGRLTMDDAEYACDPDNREYLIKGFKDNEPKPYTLVRFHRGYTAKSMVFRFDGLRIGNGNTQWGAPADRDVFIISLGERYK